MPKSRVWIHFNPQLYADIFKQIIQSTELVEIVESSPLEHRQSLAEGAVEEKVDLVILSLETGNQSEIAHLAEKFPGSELVAFSVMGDYGLRRKPGENFWEEVRPFGIQQLMQTVNDMGKTRAN